MAALMMETEFAMEAGTSLALETTTSEGAFRALADEWNQLADALPHATLFQRYDWPRAWWDVLSAHEPYIVTMRENRRLVGVAPLMKSREKFLRAFPARRLDVMASYENRHDVCLFAGEPGRAWGKLLPYLAGRRDWDVLFLNAQEEPEAPDAVLPGLCRRLGCGVVDMRTGASPFLPLPATPEEFLKGLDGKFRKGLRGAERKLAEAGPVRHEVYDSRVETLELVLERLFAVSRKGWAHAELTAIGSTEPLRKYYAGVAAMAQRNGWLQLHVLRVGERDVAFEFSLYYRGVLSNLKQGFDPELAAGSPGQVLKRYVVEDAIRRGAREYDMLGVAEPYKLKWTDLTRPRYKWAIFNRHPYARFLHAMQTKVWEPIRARRARGAEAEKE